MEKIDVEFSSFRDPSGFLFRAKGELYRQINLSYQEDYDQLMSSRLYDDLVDQGLMVSHEEQHHIPAPKPDIAYKIIKPDNVDFVSYPYEWCLLQLRGAALTTLRIARMALGYKMIMKDASAFNIQFHRGRWCLMDTLSFTKYHEGEPWIAYKQFCQHFLAPMALMAYKDPRMGLMSRLFIDGIPLDLAANLLPFRARMRFGLITHIYIHARSQKRYAGQKVAKDKLQKNFSRKAFIGLLDSLRQTIKALPVRMEPTEWENYYAKTNYSTEAFESKKAIVDKFINEVQPKTVWDLGANIGAFSRLASEKGILTVAFDNDPAAVAKNYLQVRKEREPHLLPFIMDLTNPSPGLGWGHQERMSLISRGPATLVLALALLHHLSISNNVPFQKLALFFKDICSYLIIEFIPKSDSQVSRLLATRKDIFENYHEEGFEHAFKSYFTILERREILDSDRSMYLMKKK